VQKITGSLVDIHTKQIFPASIEISEDGKIQRIQKDLSILSVSLNEAKKAPYILCGFIDSHIHEESSFLVPSEFARVALSQGIIGAVTDFHEIVHVLGIKGFDLILKNCENLPFYFSAGAPSAEVELRYTLSDIKKLLSRSDISHLGELNDFPAVLLEDERELLKIQYAFDYKKPVDGCAPGLSKSCLEKYYSAGISTDHRCISYEDAAEKLSLGIKVQLMLNSCTESITDYIPLINKFEDSIMLCSETESCFTMTKGYIRNAVVQAVKKGADLFSVLRCASLNPVQHYGIPAGLLREGDSADFIIVNNLEDFSIMHVYIKGQCIYSQDGSSSLPVQFKETMCTVNDFCTKPIHPDSLLIRSPSKTVKVHTICCYDGEVSTIHKKIMMTSYGGYLCSMPEIDCLKLVYYSRYGTFNPQAAFVQGFNLKEGAIAMSVSHDEHNIIGFGICDSDIVSAVNRVIALQGGIVFIKNGEIIAELPLPLAGIMSLDRAELVIEKIQKLKNTLAVFGCPLSKPITTLSNLAYTAMPLLKIHSTGLFDVASQESIFLIASD
jgi:adenine deaminase